MGCKRDAHIVVTREMIDAGLHELALTCDSPYILSSDITSWNLRDVYIAMRRLEPDSLSTEHQSKCNKETS